MSKDEVAVVPFFQMVLQMEMGDIIPQNLHARPSGAPLAENKTLSNRSIGLVIGQMSDGASAVICVP